MYYHGKIKFNADIVKNNEFSQNEKKYLKRLLNENDVAFRYELKALRAEINSIKNIHQQKIVKNQMNNNGKQ